MSATFKLILTNQRFSAALSAAHTIFGLEPRTLLGRSRRSSVALVRFAICRALRDVCEASYPDLGSRFDRDHTTIMYGVERAGNVAREDAEYAAAIALIAAEVRAA